MLRSIFGKERVAPAIGRTYELQLYCEHSHLPVGLPYILQQPPDWLRKIAPALRLILPAMDLLGVGLADPATSLRLQDAQEFMQNAALFADEDMEGLESIRSDQAYFAADGAYRVLREVLEKQDKTFRGMAQRLAPNGVVLWMSPEAAENNEQIMPRGPWDRLPNRG